MSQPSISTGRGGAGNIGKDETTYTDGGVVHESSADKGSGGRGGAGNIAPSPGSSPRVRAADAGTTAAPAAGASALRNAVRSEDVVPETNLNDPQPDFHTGRGGAGNEHRERYGGHSTRKEQEDADSGRQGIVGKVKELLGVGKGSA